MSTRYAGPGAWFVSNRVEPVEEPVEEVEVETKVVRKRPARKPKATEGAVVK